jgi:hypothetical protein
MAALLVACGGGDDDDSGETAEPSNPNGEATEAPTTPPDPADVAAPAPVGLGAPLGMPSVQQGASLIGSVQALAASGAGDAIYYRLSLGSNTEAYDSVALTIEYGTASIDFAALSLGVDPSAIQDICAAGETSCQVDDAAGVVSVTGLQPLRGRVFTEANDEQLQPGEALDYIIAFAISGDASAGTVVQVSVAAAGVNGEDALAPMGEGFVFEPGQWGIDGSFPADVPQIEDTGVPSQRDRTEHAERCLQLHRLAASGPRVPDGLLQHRCSGDAALRRPADDRHVDRPRVLLHQRELWVGAAVAARGLAKGR